VSFRGRPWLGGIAGFFFGLGVAVLLQQFAIWPLDNLTFFGLPIVGIALGLGVAAWGPVGRVRTEALAAPMGTGAAATGPSPEPPHAPSGDPGPPGEAGGSVEGPPG